MADYNIDPQERGFGPPNMAAQLFGMISSLPEGYQQGVKNKFERGQMARTENLQKPYEGPTDYASMLQHILKTQGTEGVAANLPNAWKQQFLQNEPPVQSPYGPGGGGGTPPGQTSGVSIHGQDPNFLHGAAGEPPREGSQPDLSAAGTDDKGSDTVRQLATERGINVDSPGFKSAFGGVGLDRELNPSQAAAIVKRFAALAKGNAASDAPQTDLPDQPSGVGAPMGQQASAQGSMPPQGPTAADQLRAAGAARLSQPGAVQPGQFGQQAPQPQQFAQAGQGVPSGAVGMVPPGADPRSYAQGLKQAAERERTAARREGIAGIPSKAREDKASAYDKTADDILKEIGEAGRATGAQKEARDRIVQTQKGSDIAQAEELKTGAALNNGLQGAAREYQGQLKPHLDAMRGIMNSPNLVTGSGVGVQEALNKIRSSPLFSSLPGYDPNAATPNEAIRKVMSASILNQVASMKDEAAEMGGSSGRIFQQQISLMEKAAQNPENTLPTLRYLTELQTRMGNHASEIAELASNYQGKFGRGVLDRGFNEALSKYNRDNPIFTPDEIKDMRRFAPPPAPAFHTKDEAVAWAHKAGIPAGDPIKLPSGKIIPAP